MALNNLKDIYFNFLLSVCWNEEIISKLFWSMRQYFDLSYFVKFLFDLEQIMCANIFLLRLQRFLSQDKQLTDIKSCIKNEITYDFFIDHIKCPILGGSPCMCIRHSVN